MLILKIPARELYRDDLGIFVDVKDTELRLEHSLVSISKWESKWKKPFLVNDPPKTFEETIDYIRCMTISQNIDPMVYYALTKREIEIVNRYIDDPMTATTFSSRDGSRPGRQKVTSELVYYWMVGYQIPFECQKWHFNRLMTLIRICEIKNAPEKKMSKSEILAQNRALNKARRAKLNTKG